MSWLFYHFYIVGHKLNCFVHLFHNHCEQQGWFSHLVWLNKNFLLVYIFHIFDALTFILQDTLTLFYFSILSHSYSFFNLEFIIFVVETIAVVNVVSQIVLFMLMGRFRTKSIYAIHNIQVQFHTKSIQTRQITL